jgi:hypothetical protein
MQIRIQFFTLMRIRIRNPTSYVLSTADPGPQPCELLMCTRTRTADLDPQLSKLLLSTYRTADPYPQPCKLILSTADPDPQLCKPLLSTADPQSCKPLLSTADPDPQPCKLQLSTADPYPQPCKLRTKYGTAQIHKPASYPSTRYCGSGSATLHATTEYVLRIRIRNPANHYLALRIRIRNPASYC